MTLDDHNIERFSRQIILPELGAEGQVLLLRSRILFVTLEPAVATGLVYLAAAGVGRLGLADGATVGVDDMGAALVFSRADVGRQVTILLISNW